MSDANLRNSQRRVWQSRRRGGGLTGSRSRRVEENAKGIQSCICQNLQTHDNGLPIAYCVCWRVGDAAEHHSRRDWDTNAGRGGFAALTCML